MIAFAVPLLRATLMAPGNTLIARNRTLPLLRRAYDLRMTTSTPSLFHSNELPRGKGSSPPLRRYNARTTRSLEITKEGEMRELMAVWPDVVEDITGMSRELNLPDVTERLRRTLEYNVPGGKCTRALTLLYAYQLLAPTDRLTRDDLYLARILGWCIEILHGFLLMLDDIMDRSMIRRKRPCWYRLEDVGVMAANDGAMMENVAYYLLHKHFRGRDSYVDIVEAYQDNVMKVHIGQCLDATNFGKTKHFHGLTMDLFDNIARYKTTSYTFVLPIRLAMLFAGIKDRELREEATALLTKIGNFFQVQDDYLSCYGKREILGKFGTDVEEGKCTWLAVNALRRATPEQRTIFTECYGSYDSDKVERVKKLYDDLDLPKVYSVYEKETYDALKRQIERMSCELPRQLFHMILDDLYRREV